MVVDPWENFYGSDPQFIEPEDIIPEQPAKEIPSYWPKMSDEKLLEYAYKQLTGDVEEYKKYWGLRNTPPYNDTSNVFSWRFNALLSYRQILYTKRVIMFLENREQQLRLF